MEGRHSPLRIQEQLVHLRDILDADFCPSSESSEDGGGRDELESVSAREDEGSSENGDDQLSHLAVHTILRVFSLENRTERENDGQNSPHRTPNTLIRQPLQRLLANLQPFNLRSDAHNLLDLLPLEWVRPHDHTPVEEIERNSVRGLDPSS